MVTLSRGKNDLFVRIQKNVNKSDTSDKGIVKCY